MKRPTPPPGYKLLTEEQTLLIEGDLLWARHREQWVPTGNAGTHRGDRLIYARKTLPTHYGAW